MNTYLPLLRELTEKLSDTPCPENKTQKRVKWNVDRGSAEGFELYVESDKVAVLRCDMPKGTVFTPHTHTENEWLVVYAGKMILNVEGKEPVLLSVGDLGYVPVGVPHSVTVLEDTKCIGITVPSSPGYPGVEVGK